MGDLTGSVKQGAEHRALVAAELRGYLRGIEDATKVCDKYAAGYTSERMPTSAHTSKSIARTIRALAKHGDR